VIIITILFMLPQVGPITLKTFNYAVIAVLVGLIGFLSPCVLPLVPGYLSYVAGLSGAGAADRHNQRRMVSGALLFVLGFTAIFVAEGVLFGSFGAAIRDHALTIERVLGAVTIVMGVVFLGGIGFRALARAGRVDGLRGFAGDGGGPLGRAPGAVGFHLRAGARGAERDKRDPVALREPVHDPGELDRERLRDVGDANRVVIDAGPSQIQTGTPNNTNNIFLPPVLFVICATPLLLRYRSNPALRGFIRGIGTAVVGVLAGTTWLIGRAAIGDLPTLMIAAICMIVLLLWRRLPEPAIIAAAGLVGLIVYRLLQPAWVLH